MAGPYSAASMWLWWLPSSAPPALPVEVSPDVLQCCLCCGPFSNAARCIPEVISGGRAVRRGTGSSTSLPKIWAAAGGMESSMERGGRRLSCHSQSALHQHSHIKEERKRKRKKSSKGHQFFWWKITQKAQITFCSGVCIWKAQSCSNYLLKRVARTQIPPSASLCRWHLDFSCVKCPWVKSHTVIWLLCIDRFSPCRGTFSCAEEEPGAGGFFKTRKNRGPKRLMSSSLSCRQACFPWLVAHLLSGVVIMCGFMVVVRYWKAIGRLFLHF